MEDLKTIDNNADMQITDGIIRFISEDSFYEKEESNKKSNIVRSLYSIHRYGYTVSDVEKCEYIMVRKATSTKSNFVRNITDISWYFDPICKETFMIISW